MNEDKKLRKRNIFVLIFEILLIVVAIGGLTLATSSLLGSKTILTFGEYNVDYVGKTEISANGLEPISDSMIDYNTRDNVIRLEFSLKGVDTNEDPEKLIYDVMINDINIDCSLLNEYTKWNLYKEGKLLSSGNFSPKFDGNILTNNYRLTEIQQKLPLSNEAYDNYVLIIWISEACEDLTSCERIDQSGIVNSKIDMNVFIALSGGEPVSYERIPNMDGTCVNRPELHDKMIPVYYDEGNWKIADSSNGDEKRIWYNYGDSKWANAVIVNSDKYVNSKKGTKVLAEDILGYYVWVPRFKYKLWNDGTTIGDSYNAYENGIDIVFESGVNSSDTVKCGDETCVYKAGEYLTHPAFDNNLRGFWISKYELSEGNKFIPNVESLRNKTIDEYKNIVNSLSDEYMDSRVVSNLEWGATLYLSHSKYGACKDNRCEEISTNDSYVSEKDKGDTTTKNVYGVYDMAGATSEYAIGGDSVGSALSEIRINDNSTWNNGIYFPVGEYTLRGGVERGIYSNSDIGMNDVTTRSVLTIKEKEDLAN